MNNETWKALPGFEGRVEVSDLGRVRTLAIRYGNVLRVRGEPLVLRPWLDGHGYAAVGFEVDGVAYEKNVHGLVATAFRGPRPPGMQCAHFDGDKTNNRASNLDWVTPAENNRHKSVHGTAARKLDPEKVLAIRTRRKEGFGYARIAREFGVNRTTIRAIARGEIWSHVFEIHSVEDLF